MTSQQTVRLCIVITALVALLIGHPLLVKSADAPSSRLYEKAKAACVEVLVNGHLNGSGCIVGADGLVLTAAHVIEEPSRKIELNTSSAGRVAASVVAVDLGHDLALLQIDSNRAAEPIKMAERPPPAGTEVFLIGAPIYRHAVLVPGKMARENLTFEYYTEHYIEVTHVAATVPMGMSGGPWLDSAGRLVGMQSGVMSQNAIPVGIAFVAPFDAVRTLLKDRQTAATPTLGLAVDELWQQDRKTLDRFPADKEGLLVTGLQDDGPAARSGLKRGDLIVAAGAKPVRLSEDLQRIVVAAKPGDSLELTILGPDGTGERKLFPKLGTLETRWQKKSGAAASATTPEK